MFSQNLYEEEYFEHILYKGFSNNTGRRNEMSCLAKYASSYTNSTKWDTVGNLDLYDFITKVSLKSTYETQLDMLINIDDLVFCPFYNNMSDSLCLFEIVKRDFQRSKIILKTMTNDQDISQRYMANEIKYISKIFLTRRNLNLKLQLLVNRINFDLYGHYTKSRDTDKPAELKDMYQSLF